MGYLLILLGILTISVMWVGLEIRGLKIVLSPPAETLPEPVSIGGSEPKSVPVGKAAFNQTSQVVPENPRVVRFTGFQFSGTNMTKPCNEDPKPTPTEEEIAEIDSYLAEV